MTKDNSKRGGMMTVFCWRPGDPPRLKFDRPFYENTHTLMYAYKTTREAVEAVLPEPLEPGPEPNVYMCMIDYPAWNATDGVAHAYNEVIVGVECQYKGEVALSIPYMYVGCTTADSSESLDIAVAMGRETRAFPKKHAEIFMNLDGPDMWTTYLRRKGKKLIELEFKFDKNVDRSEIPTTKYKRVLLPKEILSHNFMSYALQQLIAMDLDFMGNISEILLCKKGTASMKLSGIDGDALDTLKVVKPGIAVEFIQNCRLPIGEKSTCEVIASNWQA